MQVIVLLGPPGSGKGTQAEFIIKNYPFMHVSTGELLRQEIKTGTAEGKRIEEIINAGKIVDMETCMKLVKKVIELNSTKSILFDGFPRTLEQAVALDELLEQQGTAVSLVINFVISEENLVDRIINRYMCNTCGAIYNKKFKALDDSTVCDKCGGHEFKHREDDKEDVLRKRFEWYQKENDPIVSYYKNRNTNIIDIDAVGTIESIQNNINKQIEMTTRRI